MVRLRDIVVKRVAEKGEDVKREKEKRKRKNTVFLYGVSIVSNFLCLVITAHGTCHVNK